MNSSLSYIASQSNSKVAHTKVGVLFNCFFCKEQTKMGTFGLVPLYHGHMIIIACNHDRHHTVYDFNTMCDFLFQLEYF